MMLNNLRQLFPRPAALMAMMLLLPGFIPAAVMASEPVAAVAEPEKGPHRGRMLRDGDFALELAIFETGVPPEFRVWPSHQGKAIAPQQVQLTVKLTRLGDVVDDIGFYVQDDFLRGNMEIYEPHSFAVAISANHQGKQYHWQYDNFEGRTRIGDEVADAMNITTGIVGSATLSETIRAYGQLVLANDAQRQLSARFDGEIRRLYVALGDTVKKGQKLFTINSNESLQDYTVSAPTSGIVSARFGHAGEQTRGRVLLEISDHSRLVAELAVFPKQLQRLQQAANTSQASTSQNKPSAAKVAITVNGSGQTLNSRLSGQLPPLRSDQAKIVRANIDNTDGHYSAGAFVVADIEVATFTVPLAVKRSGLQSFRDFTVVYAKVGEQYEVRMLELGRIAGEWVEVLGGITAGTGYVIDNSYIIKADIEKSGASHDH